MLGLWEDRVDATGRQLLSVSGNRRPVVSLPLPSCLLQCSRGANDFVQAREPMIGDLYEQHVLPRLLFVSLDPATDMVGRTPEARTAAAVIEWETR